MVTAKVKAITELTGRLHDNVDDIYESLMDEDNGEAIKKIDETTESLKQLKQDITVKDEV